MAARPRVIPRAAESIKESSGTFECPSNTVLIGRGHWGDENASTEYTCAFIRFESVEAETSMHSWGPVHTESSGHTSLCPPSMVLTGRTHSGDEHGETQYRCSSVHLAGQALALGTTTWSDAVREDSHGFTCTGEGLLIGRKHSGDETGDTNYACAALRLDRTAGTTGSAHAGTRLSCPDGSVAGRDTGTGFTCAPLAVGGVVAEVLASTVSPWQNAATHDFSCAADTYVVAREFRTNGAEMRITCAAFGVESDRVRWGGSVRGPLMLAPATDCPANSAQVGRTRVSGGTPELRCADLVADHSAVFSRIVAENARTRVGVPATLDPANFADRTNLGLNDAEYLHLAVGGEGRTANGTIVTGFDRAVNLSHKTKNSASKDIPNLVQLHDPLLAPPYPFTAGTIDYLTVENRQLTTAQSGEIVRVLKPKGSVGLWLDMTAQVGNDGRQDAIVAELAKQLKSSAEPCVDEFGPRTQYAKVCITVQR